MIDVPIVDYVPYSFTLFKSHAYLSNFGRPFVFPIDGTFLSLFYFTRFAVCTRCFFRLS